MEGDKNKEDATLIHPILNTPPDILSSSNLPPSFNFTLTKDHYNLLHDHIVSLISTIEGLQNCAWSTKFDGWVSYFA